MPSTSRVGLGCQSGEPSLSNISNTLLAASLHGDIKACSCFCARISVQFRSIYTAANLNCSRLKALSISAVWKAFFCWTHFLIKWVFVHLCARLWAFVRLVAEGTPRLLNDLFEMLALFRCNSEHAYSHTGESGGWRPQNNWNRSCCLWNCFHFGRVAVFKSDLGTPKQ